MPRVVVTRTALFFVVFILSQVAASAQCRNGMILTGEDENYWYCSSPAEFSETAARLISAFDRAARRVNPKKNLDLKSQDKNCSSFFRAVGEEIGATSPEWNAQVQANAIIKMIRNNRATWQRVSGDDEEVTRVVQELANRGVIVVATKEGVQHGHLAIASPLPPDVQLTDFCCSGPMVRDGNVHLSAGKKRPSGWGAVRAGYAFENYSNSPAEWYIWTPSRN